MRMTAGRVTAGALAVALAAGMAIVGVSPADSTRTPLTAAGVADWQGGGWGQLPGLQDLGASGQPGQWEPGAGLDDGGGTTAANEVLDGRAATAVSTVTPAVVNIDTVLDFGSGQAAGTGIVISADGLVITNHHVVEGATAVTGTVVGTGRTYTATVLGYDPTTDIAVLDLQDASGLPVATLGDSDTVALGDLVVGVGNAGGDGGEPDAMPGVVTALDQTITATDASGGNAETLHGLIATDADIQSGQSGGPLVDASGAVIGVDVANSRTYGSSDTSGYAIPIDTAVAVAQAIVSGQESGSIQVGGTPFLGVQLGSAASSGQRDALGMVLPGAGELGTGAGDGFGASVGGVVPGSAAQAVGLAAGDTIVQIDGTAINSAEALSTLIGQRDVGDQVRITWVDPSGTTRSATATLGSGPVG